ncbi:MAG: phosphatase PAP2 family protein, partial [Duncaniella sp.]|nr:phosphatase PAP2 family protein [Duncaniella sp.]
EQILLFCNSFHTDIHYSIFWTISYRFTWIPLYLLLTFMLFRVFKAKDALLLLVCIGVTITLCDQICSHVIRGAVCRLRPSNPDNPISAFITLVDGYRSGQYGFPSCHAANTIGLATILSLAMARRWFTISIFTWAIVVCWSRLYLGVHYPSDLLVGGLIGSAIATGCFFALKSLVKLQRNAPRYVQQA